MYSTLSCRVCSDHQHFWLAALADISKGEACAATKEDRAENLAKGNTHLLHALSSLKVLFCFICDFFISIILK